MAWLQAQLFVSALLVLASQGLPVSQDQQIYEALSGRTFTWLSAAEPNGPALQFTTPPLNGLANVVLPIDAQGEKIIQIPAGFMAVQSRNLLNTQGSQVAGVPSIPANIPPGYTAGLVFIFRPIGLGAAYVPPPVQTLKPGQVVQPTTAAPTQPTVAKVNPTTVVVPTTTPVPPSPSIISVVNNVTPQNPPCTQTDDDDDEDESEIIPYAYAYKVQDPVTGDWKTVSEKSDGARVSGVYAVVDSEGNLRTVNYNVEGESGFVINEDKNPNAAPVPPVNPIQSKGLNAGANFGAKIRFGTSESEYQVSN